MGKLVIILAFTLGALLMLESVEATIDCKIYVLKMTKLGNDHVWYTVEGNPKYLEILKKSFPLNKIQIVAIFDVHVSDCMVALKNIEENVLFYNKDSRWFEVKDKLDLLRFALLFLQ